MMSEFALRRTWGPVPRYDRVMSYEPPSKDFVAVAGPCSVESVEHIQEMAGLVKAAGATHLRGGVYRAGTYPSDNFGLLDEPIRKAYWEAAQDNGLKNIVEIVDIRLSTIMSKWADCVQVGARQMQNYPLLGVVGGLQLPVFIKRHPGATLDEWLGAAEYILKAGAKEVYLIERGSSTQASHVRWDLSISMIPAAKAITKIPVICDASHGTGRRDLVRPMALAGVAAGADGVLVEVHTDPKKSLSDPDQAIEPKAFYELMQTIKKVRSVL